MTWNAANIKSNGRIWKSYCLFAEIYLFYGSENRPKLLLDIFHSNRKLFKQKHRQNGMLKGIYNIICILHIISILSMLIRSNIIRPTYCLIHFRSYWIFELVIARIVCASPLVVNVKSAIHRSGINAYFLLLACVGREEVHTPTKLSKISNIPLLYADGRPNVCSVCNVHTAYKDTRIMLSYKCK